MLLRWVLLAWCRTVTFVHDGRVTLLIPSRALLPAATLVDVFEQLRDIRTEHVSASQHQTRRQRFVPHRATRWSLLLAPSSPWLFLVHSPGAIFLRLHD